MGALLSISRCVVVRSELANATGTASCAADRKEIPVVAQGSWPCCGTGVKGMTFVIAQCDAFHSKVVVDSGRTLLYNVRPVARLISFSIVSTAFSSSSLLLDRCHLTNLRSLSWFLMMFDSGKTYLLLQ